MEPVVRVLIHIQPLHLHPLSPFSCPAAQEVSSLPLPTPPEVPGRPSPTLALVLVDRCEQAMGRGGSKQPGLHATRCPRSTKAVVGIAPTDCSYSSCCRNVKHPSLCSHPLTGRLSRLQGSGPGHALFPQRPPAGPSAGSGPPYPLGALGLGSHQRRGDRPAFGMGLSGHEVHTSHTSAPALPFRGRWE